MAFARINGVVYSFAEIRVSIGGDRFFTFDSISFNHNIDSADVYLSGAQAPSGYTQGQATLEPIKLITTIEGQTEIENALAALAGDRGLSSVEFGVTVMWEDEGKDPVLYEFEACRYTGSSVSAAQGPDAVKPELTIKYRGFKRNGVSPYRRI